jgi:nucleotide-binding universal stress UspA family protein
MNVLKNMEAIFLAALALAGATSYASAAIPAIHAIHAQHGTRVTVQQTAVDGQPMEVITVTAKRLSAAEKDRI